MLNKLSFLMDCYRTIASLPTEWLDDVSVELVIKGSEHAGPGHTYLVYIYAGTLYQVRVSYICREPVSCNALVAQFCEKPSP